MKKMANKMYDLEPGALSKVVSDDKEIPIIYNAIQRTLIKSFAEDAKHSLIYSSQTLNPPQSAVKERFNICVNWLILARRDLGFSLDRALARMYYFLRCTLDEVPINPEDWGNRGYFTGD
jgi:hypothetical protein